MNIVLLVVALLCMVFAGAFLLAAVLSFAAYDKTPVDRDTDFWLTLVAWRGGWPFILLYAVQRNWGLCPEARCLFYIGAACGLAAVLLGCGVVALGGIQ